MKIDNSDIILQSQIFIVLASNLDITIVLLYLREGRWKNP